MRLSLYEDCEDMEIAKRVKLLESRMLECKMLESRIFDTLSETLNDARGFLVSKKVTLTDKKLLKLIKNLPRITITLTCI